MIKNSEILVNQLRLKLVYKSIKQTNINLIKLSINLYNLNSVQEDEIVENLLLLEFISGLKSSINSFKKGYKNLNVQCLVTLRPNHFYYFFNLLKIFYFPKLNRRNSFTTCSFDDNFNASLKLININELSFLPEIYFKFYTNILTFYYIDNKFLFNSSKSKTKLILIYYIGVTEI